jgi:hypothetical protein
VVRHPLQRSVAEEHVDRLDRTPAAKISEDELNAVAGVLACLGDHRRRRIEADDRRVRPSIRQQSRQLAGSGTDINNHRWSTRSDPGNQVEERPGPFVAESQIRHRIPAGHRSSSSIFRTQATARPQRPVVLSAVWKVFHE